MLWKTACDVWCQVSIFSLSARPRTRREATQPESAEVARGEVLESRFLPTALQIVIDYSYDTNNFFDTQAKRDLFQEVADLYSERITDNLAAIAPTSSNTWTATFTNPSTGDDASVNNLYVATDTIVVYAGGRDLDEGTLGIGGPGGYSAHGTSTWLATVDHRGQSNATGSHPTDFGPWGGSVTFDTQGTDWYFGESASGIGPDQIDFVSVAMHELGHVLGFGTSSSFATFSTPNGFTGPKADAEYNFAGLPQLNSDDSHWADGVIDNGQEVAMDPAIASGVRKLFTNLDWAALDDIGWTLTNAPTAQSPLITMDGQVATYSRGGARTNLDSTATFDNPGALSLKGSQLTVSLLANFGKYDCLTIGTGNGITKSGANIKYNGVTIGTYTNGIGGKAFKLTFNSRATDQAVQACLRNLQFYTSSTHATTLDRTISVRMLNLSGQNSPPENKLIHVV